MLELIRNALQIIPDSVKRNLLQLQLVLAISAILELLSVVSVGPFIALAVNPTYVHENELLSWFYAWSGVTSDVQFLALVGSMFGAVFVLCNMVLLATQVYLNKVSGDLHATMAILLYRYYIEQSYLYHIKHRPGVLISKINNDTLRLSQGLVLALLQINSRFLSVVILVAALFAVNYIAALGVSLVMLAAYLGVYLYSNKQLKNSGKDRAENDKNRSVILQETFEGIKTLLFYDLQERYSSWLYKVLLRRTRIGVRERLLQDMPYFVIEAVAFLVIIAVIIFVFAVAEEPEVAVAQLSIICLAGYRLIPKFQQVYRSLATIKSSQYSLTHIYDDLIAAELNGGSKAALALTDNRFISGEGALELRNVSFAYNAGAPIFQSVNFCLRPKEVVGIVGESGAGKSTLMALMTGVLEPSEGDVIYNGCVIADTQRSTWKRAIGYVDSDTYLFEGTLLDNILLGRALDERKLKQVLAVSRVDAFLEAGNFSLYSNVGVRGGRLSSGQRQRIGFARALYGNPKILFMDEATNALDYTTQQAVIQQLKLSGFVSSMVVVSHRLDMRSNFDRCYELKFGHLVEMVE